MAAGIKAKRSIAILLSCCAVNCNGYGVETRLEAIQAIEPMLLTHG